MRFLQFVREFHREESGQDLLEYALVLVAVVGAVVLGSQSLASDITTDLGAIQGKISTAISGL
jgi:Flp pilus assembly pilin Flp